MIKYFCDGCEEEITPENDLVKDIPNNANRLSIKKICATKNTLSIEIITGLNSVWNRGTFCKYCIIDAINTLDDRPKAA